jgi:tagaturonate reductase
MEKVIQFGGGVFLRGFVDDFIHTLNEKNLFQGKVVVIKPTNRGNMEEGLEKYNLFLRGIENGKLVSEHKEITSISRGINPYVDFQEYIKLAHNPDIRYIVSNTTEAGIEFSEEDKITDEPPKTFPAKLTILLLERYKAALKGFVIMPCELIDNNGDELKKCVLKYADLWNLDDDFKEFIQKENYFCNTLVDRIVTGYPKDEITELTKIIGYEDKYIDTAEPFHLWVIQGDFENELPFNKAGLNVIWTKDVVTYKKRKVRILNGAHTSMVLAAHLYGLESVVQCMKDENMSSYINKAIFEEIIPVLGGTKEDIDFGNAIIDRFSNPYIKHLLLSIALNSVSKFKVRVLPTILEYRQKFNKNPKILTFSLAALIAFYKTDKANDDKKILEFMKAASVSDILQNESFWGMDISCLYEDVKYYYEKISSDIRSAIVEVSK